MKEITHKYKYYPNPSDEHEWKINIKGFSGDIWIVMYPSVAEKGYYTMGIINMFNGHRRRYGYSNYKNESKYILEAMLEDINEYKETGQFSKSPNRLSRL